MMLAPIRVKKSKISLFKFLLSVPILIGVFFVIIGLLTSPWMNKHLYIASMNRALSHLSAKSMIEMMGFENPYYNKSLPKDYHRFSPSVFALQMMTHINLREERSFLANVLPGFSLYDAHMVASGKGAQYTNGPNDTPPSLNKAPSKQQNTIKNQGNTKSGTSNQTQSPSSNSHVKGAEILIYSTHTWENFLPLLGLTGNPNANKAVGPGTPNQGVHLVDTWLKDDLVKDGIPTDVNYQNTATVLKAHNWDTNQAYLASRPIIQDAIKSGKPYKIILDIHRDSTRKQLTTVKINNQSYARVSMIIGKDDPHYKKNEAIAQKLNTFLKNQYPGLSRGIFEKSRATGNGVYNQDLSPDCLLFEIGGVDNNKTELKNTAVALAKILADYVKKNE